MNRRNMYLALAVLSLTGTGVAAQTFRASFDASVKADRAAGRAEPWVSKGAELVPGKFGQAVRVKTGRELIYAGEQNLQAGRGTLAFWVRIPQRPGPLDVQRLVFVQAKERGYWNYLATMEWQDSVFRAMVFDYYHGHGWHDPTGLPAFKADTWHHVALVWDQAQGTKFFLDGKLLGSTWGKQAWWERPTPHAIHLCYPGAAYDELVVYDQVLTDPEIAGLFEKNRWQVPARAEPARTRLFESLNAVGFDNLPVIDLGDKRHGPHAVIRQARVRQILDDRIPSWRVVDGRMNLFWPEWRGPVLGDVDFSGSHIHVRFEPGQQLTHLVLRGLVGGCRVFGERDGYVSGQPVARVPAGRHFLAAEKLPPNLTGLHVPRREGMRLHEIGALAVETQPRELTRKTVSTSLTGPLELDVLGEMARDIRTRTLPEERRVFGKSSAGPRATHAIAALTRVHLVTDPADALPLDAVEIRLTFVAPWKESIWWLRVQDPVNPRRDLMHLPVRVRNPAPNQEATLDVVLDFWDVMLDAGSRLWVELLPQDELQLIIGGNSSELRLWPGDRKEALAEFAHTQGQLAYSYWQLGSEADGTRGSDPNQPGFALLGHITHNRELKLTLEWVRRHVPDDRLVNNLWRITHGRGDPIPVKPRLQPAGAPEWAVWGRELLERFRSMSHHWTDRQGPDGQLGGGWNDDTDFPGVFICLPLLGDTKTQRMFVRLFDGLEKTGFLQNGVSRSPIDALHATDFLSWRAHLMLFDYGQPRHVERALTLTRELRDRWTKLDEKGHRRFLVNHYSEDGPQHLARSEVDDSGLIDQLQPAGDSETNRNFLRDPIFCAWYSRNPAVLKFVREIADGDYARLLTAKSAGSYQTYPLYSYAALFGERKFLEAPLDRFLPSDHWSVPIWRRYVERLPTGNRLDKQILESARLKTPYEEYLAAAYLVTRDKRHLVQAMRTACERLEAGWQFRGGEAGGANDHFNVPGQAALSQMYLGGALTWLRPASILPPIAVSWEGLEDRVAAVVLEASPQKLRLANYNFDEQPRKVRMRLWELEAGTYRLREGPDANADDRIDGDGQTRELAVQRGLPVELELPARRVHVVELERQQARPRPEQLPDLAVGDSDIFYDKATDRLKVVVHNIGSAAAENVVVRFECPQGNLLGQKVIHRLEAPLDLQPKTATVWLPQPTLHPVDRIVVHIDPEGKVVEITKENNRIVWWR